MSRRVGQLDGSAVSMPIVGTIVIVVSVILQLLTRILPNSCVGKSRYLGLLEVGSLSLYVRCIFSYSHARSLPLLLKQAQSRRDLSKKVLNFLQEARKEGLLPFGKKGLATSILSILPDRALCDLEGEEITSETKKTISFILDRLVVNKPALKLQLAKCEVQRFLRFLGKMYLKDPTEKGESDRRIVQAALEKLPEYSFSDIQNFILHYWIFSSFSGKEDAQQKDRIQRLRCHFLLSVWLQLKGTTFEGISALLENLTERAVEYSKRLQLPCRAIFATWIGLFDKVLELPILHEGDTTKQRMRCTACLITSASPNYIEKFLDKYGEDIFSRENPIKEVIEDARNRSTRLPKEALQENFSAFTSWVRSRYPFPDTRENNKDETPLKDITNKAK